MKSFYTCALKFISPLLLVLMIVAPAAAQELDSATMARMAALAAEQTAPVPKKDYQRAAFESGLLFDAQTATIPTKHTLEFVIQHRFGTADNGLKDLYGIWAPSNIRLGLNFTLLDNLMIGFGATKTKQMTDFQLKYNPIRQTRDDKIPVTVTLYGNMAVDGRPESTWGMTDASNHFKFSSRLSYFSQLLITRKFGRVVSLQVGPSFTHYNNVDSISDHDKVGISAAGRIKFSPQSAFIIACDWPLQIKQISEHTSFVNPPKPNLSLGIEISTSTHVFQIYLGTAQNILSQEDMMWNQNMWKIFKPPTTPAWDEHKYTSFLIGLNITRLWSF
jgi:hypothetical protein